MRWHRAGVLVLSLLAAALLGAAPSPRIVAEWSSPEAPGKQPGKVLVIAITDDREVRHRFEDKLVSHLRGRKVSAVTSYPLVPDLLDPGSREEVLRRIEEDQIDAGISFRIVPLEGRDEAAWDAEWRREAEKGGTLRDLLAATLPLKQVKSKQYGVEVTLWVAGTPSRSWTGRSGPYTLKELRNGAGDFIQDVILTLLDARRI
jgi:hypothetical protein